MSGDPLGAILRRIDRRMRALREQTGKKISYRSVSLAAGLSADFMRSLKRQYEDGTQRGVRATSIPLLAKVLKTTSEWLLYGIGPEEPSIVEDHVELKFTWSVVADGNAFVVEEWLGNNNKKEPRRWGPVPTRASARQLIDGRIAGLLELLSQQK